MSEAAKPYLIHHPGYDKRMIAGIAAGVELATPSYRSVTT
jgi:hypothetical protein